jgi:hypothetical protein
MKKPLKKHGDESWSAFHDRVRDQVLLILSPKWGIFWGNETGVGTHLSGRPVHFGLKGSADILGCTRWGQFAAVEIKTGKAIQNEAQKRFDVAVNRNHGIYVVIHNPDEVEQIFMDMEQQWKNYLQNCKLGALSSQA